MCSTDRLALGLLLTEQPAFHRRPLLFLARDDAERSGQVRRYDSDVILLCILAEIGSGSRKRAPAPPEAHDADAPQRGGFEDSRDRQYFIPAHFALRAVRVRLHRACGWTVCSEDVSRRFV